MTQRAREIAHVALHVPDTDFDEAGGDLHGVVLCCVYLTCNNVCT